MTDDLLDEWEAFAKAAGWAESTIGARRELLLLLARTTGREVQEVDAADLARFLSRYPKAATRGTYWMHARSFFAWMKLHGYRDDDPTDEVPRPRRPRGVPRPVSEAALRDILARTHLPVHAYTLLAAYAGFRAHEVAKIRGEDVDTDGSTLRVLGKGGVEAVLPMHARISALAEYMPRRGFWFPARVRPGEHIGAGRVSVRSADEFRALGHNVTLHQLRHRYGTMVLRSAGGNLRVAQELLRHSSPATTAIYTYVSDGERTAAIHALM